MKICISFGTAAAYHLIYSFIDEHCSPFILSLEVLILLFRQLQLLSQIFDYDRRLRVLTYVEGLKDILAVHQ